MNYILSNCNRISKASAKRVRRRNHSVTVHIIPAPAMPADACNVAVVGGARDGLEPRSGKSRLQMRRFAKETACSSLDCDEMV